MARSKMGRHGSVESPAAVPVQTVRYCAPAGGAARQRPGCGGAGGGGYGGAAGRGALA
jgi:hypothetical protein